MKKRQLSVHPILMLNSPLNSSLQCFTKLNSLLSYQRAQLTLSSKINRIVRKLESFRSHKYLTNSSLRQLLKNAGERIFKVKEYVFIEIISDYRCHTCIKIEEIQLCEFCFKPEEHKGHRYIDYKDSEKKCGFGWLYKEESVEEPEWRNSE